MKFLRNLKASFELESAFSAASRGNYKKAIERAETYNARFDQRSIEATLLVGHCYFNASNFQAAVKALNHAEFLLENDETLIVIDRDYLREYVRQHFDTERVPFIASDMTLHQVTNRFKKQFPITTDKIDQ